MPDRNSTWSATSLAQKGAWLALGILVVVCAPRVTDAQTRFTDKVVLQGTTASSRVTLQCEVTDYTGEAIELRTSTSKEDRRFPAAQAISAKTPRMATHDRGIEHLEKGE